MTENEINYIKQLLGVHDAIAADVCEGKRYEVRCGECQNSFEVERELFSHYLAHGWPVCCGTTMNLISLTTSKGRSSGRDPLGSKFGDGTRRK